MRLAVAAAMLVAVSAPADDGARASRQARAGARRGTIEAAAAPLAAAPSGPHVNRDNPLLPSFSMHGHGGVVVAGCGLRASGPPLARGTIDIAGIPPGARVAKAILNWAIIADAPPPATATFHRVGDPPASVSGRSLGFDISPCWPQRFIHAFSADVTALVAWPGNGAYHVELPDSGVLDMSPSAEGVALIVAYCEPASDFVDVVVYEGVESQIRGISYQTVTGFTASSPLRSAAATFVVSDGQGNQGGGGAARAHVESVEVIGPIFDGDEAVACGSPAGAFYDVDTADVGSILAAGATSLIADVEGIVDCTSWTAFVLSVSSDGSTGTCDILGVPPDATVGCDAVPPSATPTLGAGCSPGTVLTFAEIRIDGSCPDDYQLVRTWTASDPGDACSMEVTREQTLTVVDTTPPILGGVPADASAACDAVPPAPPVGASDDCDPAPAVTLAERRVDGACADAYALVRTWTATDRCGNVARASQTLTVRDTQPPLLAGVPADAAVACDAVPPPPAVSATDACDPAPAVTLAERRVDGSCADDYVLERTWTATDRCGNAASRTQRVRVRDLEPPVPLALLRPLPPSPPASPRSPASPDSARSVCSAPSAGRFEVVCAASDACDPSPRVGAAIVVTWHEVPVKGGACVLHRESIAVACGDTLDLRLVAPPCPARPPRSPRPPRSAASSGPIAIVAEAIVLEVVAADRCGNAAAARYDPSVEPSPGCEDTLPDGTCCPALGAPGPPPCKPSACEVERPLRGARRP